MQMFVTTVMYWKWWMLPGESLRVDYTHYCYLQVMYHDPLNIGCSRCVIYLKNHWELVTQTTAILLSFILSPWDQNTKPQFNHKFFCKCLVSQFMVLQSLMSNLLISLTWTKWDLWKWDHTVQISAFEDLRTRRVGINSLTIIAILPSSWWVGFR
jgi:hypothetical protein